MHSHLNSNGVHCTLEEARAARAEVKPLSVAAYDKLAPQGEPDTRCPLSDADYDRLAAATSPEMAAKHFRRASDVASKETRPSLKQGALGEGRAPVGARERASLALSARFASQGVVGPEAINRESAKQLLHEKTEAERNAAATLAEAEKTSTVINGWRAVAPQKKTPGVLGPSAWRSEAQNAAAAKVTEGILEQLRPVGWDNSAPTKAYSADSLPSPEGARGRGAASMTKFFASQGVTRGEERQTSTLPLSADGKADDASPLRQQLPDSCRAARIL